jgi:hypothetical protein
MREKNMRLRVCFIGIGVFIASQSQLIGMNKIKHTTELITKAYVGTNKIPLQRNFYLQWAKKKNKNVVWDEKDAALYRSLRQIECERNHMYNMIALHGWNGEHNTTLKELADKYDAIISKHDTLSTKLPRDSFLVFKTDTIMKLVYKRAAKDSVKK